MTTAGDALRELVLRHARIRAATAASELAGRLRVAAPPCREWIHDEPERDFPPHLALDSYAFEEDDDPGLSTGPWTGFAWVGGAFFVGDHIGCKCSEGIIPRTTSVTLTEDGPTRITYTASTELARARMAARPTTVTVNGGGAVTLPDSNPADASVDDPARRSTWFAETVSLWPVFLR